MQLKIKKIKVFVINLLHYLKFGFTYFALEFFFFAARGHLVPTASKLSIELGKLAPLSDDFVLRIKIRQ